jgi:predicted dienelactone hydrolase
MRTLLATMALALSTLMALDALQATPQLFAGYQSQRIVDDARMRPIHLDIWYPTAARPEQPHRYGLSAGRVVSGGELAGAKLPVVLLSHGAMGTAANYSWLAEHLARRGYVVLGVSHLGESPVFGSDSLDPSAVGRFDDRTQDLNAGLTYLLERSSFAARLDGARLAAVGHSSGGASVLMLAGVEFSAADLASYCASNARAQDKGCQYPAGDARRARQPPAVSGRRLKALVTLDPAVGPGFSEAALQSLTVPTLVIGSVRNDFLPYASHAGRVAANVRGAQILPLDRGEGHFVYVDECALPIEVMGVRLCSDAQRVDRKAVHETLAESIARFLGSALSVR